MTIIKRLSASLIVITILAAPAVARENVAADHFIAIKGKPGAGSARWIYGRASASETPVHGGCDAGDNPGIC
jgi:hypothetical protein